MESTGESARLQRSEKAENTDHMKNLSNIEHSRFRRGEYVGYCQGVQRIRRGGLGWQTYALGSSAGQFVAMSARTLEELNAKLQEANK